MDNTEEIAARIKNCLSELNKALKSAHEAGLKVEITHTDIQYTHNWESLRTYRADVWRPVLRG